MAEVLERGAGGAAPPLPLRERVGVRGGGGALSEHGAARPPHPAAAAATFSLKGRREDGLAPETLR